MSKITLSMYNFFLFLHKNNIPIIPKLLNIIFLRLIFNCQIGLGAKIGKNVNLGYGGLGCVIHQKAIIGNGTRIGTNVTIGGTTKKHIVPKIGDNCIIATGAKVLGPIVIGNESVIGANAVVVHNIPNNSLAVGIPAKVIKSNIIMSDYK